MDTRIKHYAAIDGIRTIACIGIVMMHVASNNEYKISGFLYETVIPSFTDFVFLFMIVSAFGMCCGYYDSLLNNQFSISEFYNRRIKKILPFFTVLIILDIIVSPSVNSLYEAFADVTLLFGFLPDAGHISVIGVGWFLGLIFVFYLCFPFFCFLLNNKRRAWISFGISIIYHLLCAYYFGVGRTNILYSGCFFLAGGLVYLYRMEIEKFNKWIISGCIIGSTVLYFLFDRASIIYLLISIFSLMYAILVNNSILNNRFTKFFRTISMEVYLSHMVIFRLSEISGITVSIGNGWLQYFITVITVVCGSVIFSLFLKKIINYLLQAT